MRSLPPKGLFGLGPAEPDPSLFLGFAGGRLATASGGASSTALDADPGGQRGLALQHNGSGAAYHVLAAGVDEVVV